MKKYSGEGRKGLWRDQRGITGLETAIVLIAFVVVASVFAFAVLSTGLLSSEKSKETVLSGLEETQSTITLRGAVIANSANPGYTTSTVSTVVFQIANAQTGGEAVDLGSDAVIMTYIDSAQSENLDADASPGWATEWLSGTGPLLDTGERVEVTVTLTGLAGNDLGTDTDFTLQMKPSLGAVLVIGRTTPAVLTAVSNLQ